MIPIKYQEFSSGIQEYLLANAETIGLVLLSLPIFAYLHMSVLWLFYLAAMNLENVHKRAGLTKQSRFLSMPLYMIGVAVNFFFTVIWGTIIFFDLPRENAFSNRLGRYCSNPEYEGTKRRKMAMWFAHKLINPHDFYGGNHIKGS